MKPVDAKSQIVNSLNIVDFRISEIEKHKETLLAYFEDHGARVFNENSFEDLMKCKDELVKNFKRKEEDLVTVDERLVNLRKNKDGLQKQLEQMQFLERDQSEINIKVKDYRERILQVISIDLAGNETDKKLNEMVLNRSQGQYEVLSKEVNSETQKIEQQEQAIENDLNNFRSSLSSKVGLIDNNENEFRMSNDKIQRLTGEVSRLSKAAKSGQSGVEQELEALNEQIDDLKENVALYNDNLNKRTKEMFELSEQMSSSAKNKVITLFRGPQPVLGTAVETSRYPINTERV